MKRLILILTSSLLLTACGEKPRTESEKVFDLLGYSTENLKILDNAPVLDRDYIYKIRFSTEERPGEACTFEFDKAFLYTKTFCRKLDASNVLDF